MRFNISFNDEDKWIVPIASQPKNASDAIALARSLIERDFSAFVEQQPRLFRLALNEAEALAWESGFPELVFPILAQENAAKLASWYQRQQFVRRSQPAQAFAA